MRLVSHHILPIDPTLPHCSEAATYLYHCDIKNILQILNLTYLHLRNLSKYTKKQEGCHAFELFFSPRHYLNWLYSA